MMDIKAYEVEAWCSFGNDQGSLDTVILSATDRDEAKSLALTMLRTRYDDVVLVSAMNYNGGA